MIRKLFPFFTLILITGIFFWQFLIKGLMPIPSDTIIGLYHPYRDLYTEEYPNGIPFKNFLITDPVRQLYPWKNLSIDILGGFEIPVWNPYSFSGTPLLANFQSAVFYPLNIIFFILPFQISWSFLIMLQPFLAGIFLFFYLKNLKLDIYSSLLGAVVFSFSGFFTTWLEWGTVLHTALWLPLILLSMDKILEKTKEKKQIIIWAFIFVFSVISSFFGGHLQTFFYLSIVVLIYAIARLWQKRNIKFGIILAVISFLALLISSIQLIPTLNYISLSARGADQFLWQKEGWFLPWQHLIQFIVPDFFGNPTTLNYWGTWNYGELTPYIGILPLIAAFSAIIFRRDKKTYFFVSILILSLVLALPTPIAKLPFILDIPFISSSQPTRLIFLIDFSLAVLAAFGLNYFIKKEKLKELIVSILPVVFLFACVLLFTQFGSQFVSSENLGVLKRNLIFPSAIFILSIILFLIFSKTNRNLRKYILGLLILLTVIDLFRFSWKFNTFSKSEYLYPATQSIEFIKNNIGDYRIVTDDPRILPPNFSSFYKIQSVEGYDPLFLNRYAEFISAINRGEPDINPPFGFNRIVRIENFSSNLVDLLGVKYLLSLSETENKKFEKVFEEGQTKVYKNKNVAPKVFFTKNVKFAKDKQNAINLMFDIKFSYLDDAIVEKDLGKRNLGKGSAEIIDYSENQVMIETENDKEGFLVLTDIYYPSWRARIDDKSEVEIYVADYIFRGVLVPPGKHKIQFYNTLL